MASPDAYRGENVASFMVMINEILCHICRKNEFRKWGLFSIIMFRFTFVERHSVQKDWTIDWLIDCILDRCKCYRWLIDWYLTIFPSSREHWPGSKKKQSRPPTPVSVEWRNEMNVFLNLKSCFLFATRCKWGATEPTVWDKKLQTKKAAMIMKTP